MHYQTIRVTPGVALARLSAILWERFSTLALDFSSWTGFLALDPMRGHPQIRDETQGSARGFDGLPIVASGDIYRDGV
jgi:hypothetical protein